MTKLVAKETRVALGSGFDPSMIRDEQWVFHKFSDDGVYKYFRYTDPALDITIEKKVLADPDSLIRRNQELLKESQHKRWGDGKVVARVPLNVFFEQFDGKHNDPQFTEWWVNNSDNAVWRTFKGTV